MKFFNTAFLFLIILASSCVTNKKVQYMQHDDVNARQHSLPTDTVVRTYNLPEYTYLIQPEDVLYIKINSLTGEEYDFFAETEENIGNSGGQNMSFRGELVDPEGMIEYPVVGKVEVGGKTIFQIQEELKLLAAQYVSEPVVKVRILNFRFSVLGEVNIEKSVILQNHRVSLPEAIAMAGGMGELADRSQIKLIRSNKGISDVIYIDLLDEDLLDSPYYYMHQGDILIVPPLRQRPMRKYFGQNIALFVSTVSVVLLALNLIK
ncbi:polysaccharide biosynthesis/export family protein [Marinigracilibium pacificum]|uniref:Polysaccharide export protein n=1 Tax=Marinigracilibium pacificum TaxID=2729599 RepID=A0A848J0Q1_9BACT|nr:polysaccharide biosynthesis/export family protein [Marinigracilibium pacificum]NMM48054.1 polysaccharide export protein [Marinigracilibium pacificum]